MSIEEAIVAVLTGAPGVTALVAGRVYPMLAARGAPTPLIVYQRVSGVPDTTMDGAEAGGLVTARIQITSFALDYPTVRSLAKSVRAVLHGYRGGPNGMIQSCFEVGQGDILDASADDAANREYGFRSDYRVIASET